MRIKPAIIDIRITFSVVSQLENHMDSAIHLIFWLVARVPQCLLFLGVLNYSGDLWKSLEAREQLTSGGEREVEIRGCSIWAVEVWLR